jgi:hypothetical protein
VSRVVLPDLIESTSDDVYGVTVSNGYYPVTISQGVTINCFHSKYFIPQMPPDMELTPVSRTIGTN